MRYLRFSTVATVLFAIFAASAAGQGFDFQTTTGDGQAQVEQRAASKRPVPHTQAAPFRMPQYAMPGYNMPGYNMPEKQMPDYNPTGGQTQWFDEGSYRVSSTNMKGNPFYQHYIGNRDSRADVIDQVNTPNPHARVRTGSSSAEIEQNRTPGMASGGSYQAEVVHKPMTASEGAYAAQGVTVPRHMTPVRVASNPPVPNQAPPRQATVIHPLTGQPITGQVVQPPQASRPTVVTVSSNQATERTYKRPRVIESGVDENGQWKAKVIIPGRTSAAGQLAPIVTPRRRSVEAPVQQQTPPPQTQPMEQPRTSQAARPGLAPIDYGEPTVARPNNRYASQAPQQQHATAGQHRYGVTSPRPSFMDPMLEETGTFQPAPITVERPTNLAAPAAPQNMGPMLEEVDSFRPAPVTVERPSNLAAPAGPQNMGSMLEEVDTFRRAPITVGRPPAIAAPATPQNTGSMLEEVDSFQQTPAPAMSEPRSYPVIDEPEKTSNFDYPGSANSTTSIRGVTTSQETFNPIVGGYHQPLRENPAISPVAPYRDPRTIQE